MPVTPRTGRLRHRVTLQKRTLAGNEYGESEETWSDVCKRWAAIEPISGREFTADGARFGEVTHRILMRNAPCRIVADRTYRFTYKDRTFGIEHIADRDERGFQLELLCREAVP